METQSQTLQDPQALQEGLAREISLSRSRVYDMLEDIDRNDLVERLSQNDWTVVWEVRKLYVQEASYDSSVASTEGAIDMADTDIDVLLMEMNMVPVDQASINHILCEVEKVAIPEDIALIERIRKANGPESTVLDMMAIMDGIGDICVREEQCYTTLLMSCVDNVVNQTDLGEDEEGDELDWEALDSVSETESRLPAGDSLKGKGDF